MPPVELPAPLREVVKKLRRATCGLTARLLVDEVDRPPVDERLPVTELLRRAGIVGLMDARDWTVERG